MHDHVGTFVPDWYHGRTWFAFEYEACDTPLEVAHGTFGMLMYFSFGEYMDPGVAAGAVSRGCGEYVRSIGCVGKGWVSEGIVDILRTWYLERFRPVWVRSCRSSEGSIGQKADTLRYCWLEKAAVDGVR
jgi:hypothetical protein